MATKKENLGSVQVLRWIAASLVVVGHSQQEMTKVALRTHQDYHPFLGVEFGIGVDIFFVISGFLMFYVAGREYGVPGSPWLFLKRRFVRIVPLYWIMTTLMIVAMLLVPGLLNHAKLRPVHVLMSYLMLAWPNGDGQTFPVLGLGWTLNFEFFFYLVFALSLAFPRRAGVPLLALLLGATTLGGALYDGTNWVIRFYGQSIVLEFVAGLFLAIAFLRGLRIPSAVAVGVLLGAIALHLLVRNEVPGAPRLLVNGLPGLLLFFGFVFSAHALLRGRAGEFAEALGDSSYALYLTHPFALNLAVEVLHRAGLSSPPVIVASAALFALAVGWAGYRFVERPLLGVVKNWVFAKKVTSAGTRTIDHATPAGS